ncbi:MAG: PAS domain-containing sensor histidine kinase [Chloroflexota bacterium]
MNDTEDNDHLHALLEQLQASIDEPLTTYLERQVRLQKQTQTTPPVPDPLVYRALFDTTSDAVYIFNADLTYIGMNPRGAAMLGYTVDEMQGITALDRLAPGEINDAHERVAQLLNSPGGSIPAYERKFLHKDGHIIYCEISPILVRNADGNPSYIFSVVRDVSERKQYEQSIRTSEQTAYEFQNYLKELHKLNFDLANAGSLDDLYRKAVVAGTERLGFDRVALFIAPEDTNLILGTYGTDNDGYIQREYYYRSTRDEWQAVIDATLSNREQAAFWHGQLPITDYEVPALEDWNAVAALWDGDRAPGYIAIDNMRHRQPPRPYARDLLALYGQTIGHTVGRRMRMADLELSEQSIRQLLESSPVAILVLDTDSHIERTNLRAREMFGYAQPDALPGMDIETLVPGMWEHLATIYPHRDPDDLQEATPRLGLNRDLMGVRENGSEIPIEMFISTITINHEASMVCFINDLTEHVELEQRRVELLLEKERSILLSSFIRDASHEFKTPLSVIHTRTYLLRRLADNPAMERHFKMIDQQVTGITRLVDDLALMARLDGMIRLKPARYHALSILEKVMRDFQDSINWRSIRVRWDVEHPGPVVRCDNDLMQVALTRIIDNAVRYSHDGGTITLSCYTADDHVILEVADRGIGIEEEYISRVTERLYRVDSAHTTPGFGLGLSIADKIVSMHNGTLSITSTPGAGTTVSITLPAGE